MLDTRHDGDYFVDRVTELAKIRAGLASGLNVLILGERGAGRTSLVRRAMFELGHRGGGGYEFVFVRGAGARSAVELLGRAVAQATGEPEDPASPVEQLLASFRAWTSDRLAHGSPVLVLDDAPAAVAQGLFGPLRDELWATGVPWLVTCHTEAATELLVPPADVFFEVRVTLSRLDSRAATELIGRRTQPTVVPAADLGHALELADGNPRRLIDVVRSLMDEGAGSAVLHQHRARERAVSELGRSAHMLFVELEHLGQASASDAGLLTRMGWTRPRVVQVLAELEDAGLVTSAPVKNQGGGRPRKVYSVVPASEFGPESQRSTA